jgi:hypothetical protein
MEDLFYADFHPESRLTDTQAAEVEARLADPGPLATTAEVEAFFARLTA